MGGVTPAGEQVRDPGLQPERTRLAWRRTTLSCTVAAVLAGRAALHHGPTVPGVLACALCLLLWLGFLAVAHRRMVALSACRPRTLALGTARAAALCTLAFAVCAAAMVF
ncbi:DUF202 domain-containing protein [Streptomyces kanamyceticus]|uniref:DUF202 domain-containing protein n=1 Tax=Streptomyces kanamyceticus TaxID=1967 RepID=A0A5J6GN72_STRKN|nr:DUF202 domain-containing protein [Streptomyces kanamyceticus]QEU95435.1 DUF202 domain-containing protein [Streptomyces kanamyceticus]